MVNTKYKRLIINGELFENSQLQHLCDTKLAKAETPIWEQHIYQFISDWLSPNSHVEVKTSGSTGEPKVIQIDKEQMVASAKLTQKTFKLKSGNTALLCLPANHIAGKMMIARAFVIGLNLIFREPSSKPLSNLVSQIDFAAMVPLQVHNSLKCTRKRLQNISKLIIGGGAIREELLNEIENFPNEIYGTYGMTETLTHIAIANLKVKNKAHYYKALDGIKISVDERDCLKIDASHLNEQFTTNDLVRIIDKNSFEVLGRIDHIINSGGLKFNPELIEKKIESIIPNNYIISSMKDEELGDRLVLLIESNKYSLSSLYELWTKLEQNLEKKEIPKHIEFLDQFRFTENGKIDRKKTKEMV